MSERGVLSLSRVEENYEIKITIRIVPPLSTLSIPIQLRTISAHTKTCILYGAVWKSAASNP